MTKGRPFTDSEFKPNGRPFNDPTHPNYDKFNPEPEAEEPEVEEPEVEEPEVEDPEVEAPEIEEPTVEEPVINEIDGESAEPEGDPTQDKGEPATTEAPDNADFLPPEEEVIDKGLPATTESPASEETVFSDSGLNGLIEEPQVEEVVSAATTFALREDDIIDAVDPLMPTIFGTDESERIKGTRGDDIIFGGLGADKFKVKKGNDIILDFEVGVDSLKGKFRDVELSMVGDSTLMEHERGSVLFDEVKLTAVDIFG